MGRFPGNAHCPSYFITAAHVGGSSGQVFRFQGDTYTIDATYGSAGARSIPGTDLKVWKINGEFNTFAEIYTAQDEVGRHMVVFGRGTAPGAAVMVDGNQRLALESRRRPPELGETMSRALSTIPAPVICCSSSSTMAQRPMRGTCPTVTLAVPFSSRRTASGNSPDQLCG